MKANRSIVMFSVALTVISALATVFDATSIGDISDGSFWTELGYSGAPGAGDTVKLNARAINPTFTALADMSILDIMFNVSGSYIDLSANNPTIRINQAADRRGMEFVAKSAGYRVTGGTWYFVNKAHLYCGQYGTSSYNNHIIEFDGTVVTNVGRFYGSYYDRNTQVTLSNGTRVYADNLYAVYGNYASNSTLTVKGGSKLISFGRMVYDQFPTTFTPGVSEGGCNRLNVTGADSLLQCGGESLFGIAVPSNTLMVTAGATLTLGALNVGRLASLGNVMVAEGAGTTFNTGRILLGEQAGCGDNRLEVRDGVSAYNSSSFVIGRTAGGNEMRISSATTSSGAIILGEGETSSGNRLTIEGTADVTLRSSTSNIVGNAGSGNRFDFTGGTLRFNSKGHVVVGVEASSSNNVFRIAGASAVLSQADTPADPFGAGSHNTVLIEDGAAVGGFQLNAASSSSNCLLRVKNATFGTEATAHHGALGTGQPESRGNRMELVEGSTANFLSFSISSYDNALLVSNATLVANDSSRGIRVGYTTGSTVASNCSVTVAGPTSRIETNGPLSLNNHSRLHFIVPDNGWATVPIMADTLSVARNARLTVDCAAFIEHRGGTITLLSTTNGFGDNIDTVLAAANADGMLPSGCRLYRDGNDLRLRTPRLGFSVILR